MDDLEKVMQGLNCCILHDPDDTRRCSECPYNQEGVTNSPCVNGLMCDARLLLKPFQEAEDIIAGRVEAKEYHSAAEMVQDIMNDHGAEGR